MKNEIRELMSNSFKLLMYFLVLIGVIIFLFFLVRWLV